MRTPSLAFGIGGICRNRLIRSSRRAAGRLLRWRHTIMRLYWRAAFKVTASLWLQPLVLAPVVLVSWLPPSLLLLLLWLPPVVLVVLLLPAAFSCVAALAAFSSAACRLLFCCCLGYLLLCCLPPPLQSQIIQFTCSCD